MSLPGIHRCELPPDALLRRYSAVGEGDRSQAYTDCYSTQVASVVGLREFVLAFYTTPLFRIERWILALIGRPSSDEQAAELSQGDLREFAAWTVEDRNGTQLLMCDFRGLTRSWFMVAEADSDGAPVTALYFGSAVVTNRRSGREKPEHGWLFRFLLGFHKLYSKALLAAASRRIRNA